MYFNLIFGLNRFYLQNKITLSLLTRIKQIKLICQDKTLDFLKIQFLIIKERELPPQGGGNDQAIKSVWWMPWHLAPMKDVISCEKLRGVAHKL